ncbi:MAG: M20/M25/M40 family metallo-hydrolase [Candidatus Thorarchaeota archaeon]|jgi:acetylornithine deacetylase/succinyl-diaminopimelate desuccinylase-like protein
MLSKLMAQIEKNYDKAIEDLKELCRIPSVAAKNQGIEEAAEFVAKMLENAGLESELHKTSGSPVVTGSLDVGAERTLLFYNHYDVQPAEPFDLWDSPPFEPEIRDGRFYARGVADNKGNIVSRAWAVRAFADSGIESPINIRFVIEGEEEVASLHLNEFTERNPNFITADGGIWEFGYTGFDGIQEAYLGLKGDFYVQLEVESLSRDVHSSVACILPSAPDRLLGALRSIKGSDNKVLIEGFYDGIKPLTEAEWNAIDPIDMREEDMKQHYGIDDFLDGLNGNDLKEAYYNSPTCTICGLTSGYQEEGSMTVLPAKASAKVDFRLVEGQDYKVILGNLRKHLDKHGFNDVKIAWYEGYNAAKTSVDHPFVDVVRRANQEVFGELRVHPTSPGSGPLFLFKDYVPMVAVGCGDHLSGAHSPNESIKVDDFLKDMKRFAALFVEMGAWRKESH